MLAVLLGLLSGCGGEVNLSPPQAVEDSSGDRALQAQKALDALVSSVRSGTRRDAVAQAAPESAELLGWVHDNATALRIDDLEMRLVDEAAPLDAADQSVAGQGAWRGSVQLQYRYGGFDRSPGRFETSAIFLPTQAGTRIVSFGGDQARTPLWLVDRLSVVRTGRSLLVVAADRAGRYPGLVAKALRQVARVLPGWSGPLLVEVPRTRAQLDAALEAQPGRYDEIAAVTTTADGSLTPGSPVRVLINPTVFGKLAKRGAQVVMSHEATHVATAAPFTSVPTWLLEGFADFVALDDAGVPVRVAARQILAQIKKSGLPEGLPTSADLQPTANQLGATYEEAWLACRFLAQEFGRDRLVRFYRTVSEGARASQAFQIELGTTQSRFVNRWRADLARLAGVAR